LPDSFEFDTNCSRLQDLNTENLLLESTCRNWGYTCAAQEPAEYPAGATEEQKQVPSHFENMWYYVSSTRAVVQSGCVVLDIFDAMAVNSAVSVVDYIFMFARCHAESSKICHSCQSALV